VVKESERRTGDGGQQAAAGPSIPQGERSKRGRSAAQRPPSNAKSLSDNIAALLNALADQIVPEAITLNQKHNHDQNNQDFLDSLNLATAKIRTILEKQPSLKPISTKKSNPSP